MKHLYVLRHAKAVGYTATDHERALAGRGRRQAESMKQKLAGIDFGCAIVSDSQRTQQTFDALDLAVTPAISPQAYNATHDQLEALVRTAPAHVQNVLLIAHNPGVSDLACAAGATQELGTCDLAILAFEGDWSDFVAELARCIDIVHPDEV